MKTRAGVIVLIVLIVVVITCLFSNLLQVEERQEVILTSGPITLMSDIDEQIGRAVREDIKSLIAYKIAPVILGIVLIISMSMLIFAKKRKVRILGSFLISAVIIILFILERMAT